MYIDMCIYIYVYHGTNSPNIYVPTQTPKLIRPGPNIDSAWHLCWGQKVKSFSGAKDSAGMSQRKTQRWPAREVRKRF